MDADVQLESFTVDSFPTLRIHGDNLKLRLKGQQQPAPFIEIRHFEVTGGLFGLLRKQRRFRSVELAGLQITIPPRTRDDKEAGNATRVHSGEGPGPHRSRHREGRAADHRAQGSAQGAEDLVDPPSRSRVGRIQSRDAVRRRR